MSKSFEQIPLEDFTKAFSSTIGAYVGLSKPERPLTSHLELSSVAIGGQVVSVSDEFFAEAFHLLLVEVICTPIFSITDD